jgi:O-antigen ligase
VERVKTGFWSLSQNKISKLFFYLLVLFLPTQLGKHFWPNWSFVYGLRLDYLSPTLYFTDILIAIIFIFSFREFYVWLRKLQKKYLAAFAFVLVILLLSLSGAKNYWAGIYGLIKFLEFSYLVYFIVQNFKAFNKVTLFICVFVSVLFESLLGFFQYLSQGSLNGIFYYLGERTFNGLTPGIANASINGQLFLRPYATFSHPNVLSGFLILSMLLLLLFSLGNKKLRYIAWGGVITGTVILLIALSRVAIIFWAFCLIVLFGFSLAEKYKKQKFNPLLLIGISVIVLTTIIIVIMQDNFIAQRFLTTKLSDESIVQRQSLIAQSFKMFQGSPIIGVGINNIYNNLNIASVKGVNFLIQPVHNIFLLVLSETGVIGLVTFLFVFLKSFLAVIKKRNIYLLLSLLAITILGMFDHYFLTLQQGQLLFSLVLGIALSKS